MSGRSVITEVQHLELLKDLIRRELKHQKLYTNFFVNPLKPAPYITEKPTDFASDEMPEEALFVSELKKAEHPPRLKYKYPQTTNMDYGWICDDKVFIDRLDPRFNFAKARSDMYLYMQPKVIKTEKEERVAETRRPTIKSIGDDKNGKPNPNEPK